MKSNVISISTRLPVTHTTNRRFSFSDLDQEEWDGLMRKADVKSRLPILGVGLFAFLYTAAHLVWMWVR